MVTVEEFIASPSEELLDLCTREQLLKIAESYEIDVGDKCQKERVKSVLKACLLKNKVMPEAPLNVPFPHNVLYPPVTTTGLTFDQQKELLLLQLEHDKFKLKAETEKQLAVERLRQQTEQAKSGVEQARLQLIKEGKLLAGSEVSGRSVLLSEQSAANFDVVGNLRLLPKFSEREPESFFSLFEHIADAHNWPDSARTLMLQCVLTGRAQEAYSALSDAESQKYHFFKSAVLKAYELVLEAYRQQFRTWKISEKQSHLEFARDLTNHFTCSCSASGVDHFEGLCDLTVFEQFKNSVPVCVATYLSVQQAQNVAEAAALADDYVLMHRGSFDEPRVGYGNRDSVAGVESFGWHAKPFHMERKGGSIPREEKVCSYCHKQGHWKADCHFLKCKP